MALRPLDPEERALWEKVIATVRPIERPKAAVAVRTGGAVEAAEPERPDPAPKLRGRVSPARPQPAAGPPRVAPGETLDGGWDRRLSRGLVAPDISIDLHGHTLDSAYSALDHGLARAIGNGARLLLLVTGKPPAVRDGGPPRRGLIRAAVGDWLAASRHAGQIAAVRNAHPRHGGAGALYIVLRRPR